MEYKDVKTLEELRELLISEYPNLTATISNQGRDSGSAVSLQDAVRYRDERLIFALSHHGEEYYPLFQFDDKTSMPKPAYRELIKIFDLHKHDSWELFIWLTCPTGLLGGIRPVDIVDRDPVRVIEAAMRERRGWDF